MGLFSIGCPTNNFETPIDNDKSQKRRRNYRKDGIAI